MLDASDMPSPIPPEADLRDFPFMPLEIARLRRSKAWLYCKRRPELAFYMLNLWTAAWHDRPAGSLEADDEVLADLAMATRDRWKKVRDPVLRGWARHSDGRIYHPVVTEKVNGAWQQKLAQRERTLRGRIVALEKKLKDCKDENSKSLMQQQLALLSQELSQALSRKQSQALSQNSDRRLTGANREGERHRDRDRDREGEGEGYISSARGSNGEKHDLPSALELDPVAQHERFERVMAIYPKFVGAPQLIDVEKACRDRIAEGATWDELEAAAKRFTEFVKAGGRSSPQYVDAPLKFFGSQKWRDPWTPPPSKAEQRQAGNIDETEQWLRERRGVNAT